jgi:hypothetical protein
MRRRAAAVQDAGALGGGPGMARSVRECVQPPGALPARPHLYAGLEAPRRRVFDGRLFSCVAIGFTKRSIS